MAQLEEIAVTTSKSFSFWLFLKYGLLSLFVILFILDVGYTALQTRSLTPVIKEVGNQLLFSTIKISELSKNIIAQQGLYIPSDNFWHGIKYLLFDTADLFKNLYVIYIWLWIFSFLVPYTGLCTADEKLKKLLFSLVIFFLFQILVSLIYAAIDNKINTFADGMYYILMPFTCFIDLFNALPYILKPAHNIAAKACNLNNYSCIR